MAKAVSSKTESLTVRVPVELISQWREVAQKADISVAALVIDLAKRGARLSAAPILLLPPADATKAIGPTDTEAEKPTPIVDPRKPRPVMGGSLLGNPVLASAVPRVDGTVDWCGLKQKAQGKGKR